MTNSPYPARFSVYWTPLDPTVGAEMKKTRPCVVVSPDEMNAALETVIVAPLTHGNRNWPSRLQVKLKGAPSVVACDQLRAVSISRLGRQAGFISPSEQRQLMNTIQSMFAL